MFDLKPKGLFFLVGMLFYQPSTFGSCISDLGGNAVRLSLATLLPVLDSSGKIDPTKVRVLEFEKGLYLGTDVIAEPSEGLEDVLGDFVGRPVSVRISRTGTLYDVSPAVSAYSTIEGVVSERSKTGFILSVEDKNIDLRISSKVHLAATAFKKDHHLVGSGLVVGDKIRVVVKIDDTGGITLPKIPLVVLLQASPSSSENRGIRLGTQEVNNENLRSKLQELREISNTPDLPLETKLLIFSEAATQQLGIVSGRSHPSPDRGRVIEVSLRGLLDLLKESPTPSQRIQVFRTLGGLFREIYRSRSVPGKSFLLSVFVNEAVSLALLRAPRDSLREMTGPNFRIVEVLALASGMTRYELHPINRSIESEEGFRRSALSF